MLREGKLEMNFEFSNIRQKEGKVKYSTSEMKHSHILQILCLLFFYIIWAIDSFFLKASTFLENYVPLPIRLAISLSIIAAGSFLIARAHQQLFKDKPADLITTGIFAHVRHPMYLGIILTYLGWIIATFSLLTFIPWILAVILYVKMANHEEKQLEERFGEKYEEYKRKVPKWIPKLKTE